MNRHTLSHESILQPAEQAAMIRLQDHLLLKNVSITRIPGLDVAGYFAFSVIPKDSGRAGEVTFLANAEQILAEGETDRFDKVIKKILERGEIPSLPVFAGLFLRMKDIRYGVILEQPAGHVLMKPEQLPAHLFKPPALTRNDDGLCCEFWFFDTDRLLPVHYSIRVNNKGTVDWQATELKDKEHTN